MYDVIVLGLGAMGSAACYHLTKRGQKVLGLEQFQVGHDRGSSHGETRIIRKAYWEDPSYIPLLERAYELWEQLEEDSHESILMKCGLVMYGDPSRSSVVRGTLESAAHHGLPLDRLTRDSAISRFPMYRPLEGTEAVFESDAGFLYSDRAVAAHVACARHQGAQIQEGETILAFRSDGDHVTVETDRGQYQASRLVVTGGSWSRNLLRDIGLPLEIHRVLLYWFGAGSVHDVNAGTPCFMFDLGNELFYGFPMLDGRSVKIAGHFRMEKITDPAEKAVPFPSAPALHAVQSCIKNCLPEMTDRLVRFASCIYTMTPDQNFIIDRHPQHENIVFAAGFSGHGFKFSSVVGEILADLTLDGRTDHPIDFLRLKRFQ